MQTKQDKKSTQTADLARLFLNHANLMFIPKTFLVSILQRKRNFFTQSLLQLNSPLILIFVNHRRKLTSSVINSSHGQ